MELAKVGSTPTLHTALPIPHLVATVNPVTGYHTISHIITLGTIERECISRHRREYLPCHMTDPSCPKRPPPSRHGRTAV